MACMLMLTLNWDADTAIEYLMSHYCEEVIDTTEQELYVRSFEDYLKKKLHRKLQSIQFIKEDDKPQVEQCNILPSEAWCQTCKLADIDCTCEDGKSKASSFNSPLQHMAEMIAKEKETDQDELDAANRTQEFVNTERLPPVDTTQWYVGANGSAKGIVFQWPLFDNDTRPAEKDVLAGPFNSEAEALIWQQGLHTGDN